MLRTVLTIGALALLGLFALNFFFGILSFLFSLLLVLLVWAIKIAVVALIVYFVIRVLSPDTARRMRERWNGPSV